MKGYVTNRDRPEGSIAEAYIVKECITFCSMYIDEIETVFDRPERNIDRGERGLGMTIFTDPAHPFGLVLRSGKISQEFRDNVHWFLISITLRWSRIWSKQLIKYSYYYC